MKSEFALGKGRTPESIAASHMMNPAEAAEALIYTCSTPPNVRIPQMTMRHMG